MNLNSANINSLWGSLIVEELIRHGIDYFCISPGSRSTPLVAAIAAHPEAKTVIHFDERGAAFHALGYARGAGKPAVLVCTSGTAAANYLPAIVEASVDCLPLIVLTADRPPELRDTGANQTIDQVNLYGKFTRFFHDLPCPDSAIPLKVLLSTIDLAVSQAIRMPRGPVHINCMFREPLSPTVSGEDFEQYLSPIKDWQESQLPFSRIATPDPGAPKDEIEKVLASIQKSSRGVLVLGQLRDATDQDAVLRLIQTLNWPVFADIQSGLSQSGHHQIIQHFDLLLTSREFAGKNQPDLILQLGSRLTSKRLLQWIETSKPAHIQVLDHPYRHDPTHTVTQLIESSIASFCDQLISTGTTIPAGGLLPSFQQASRCIEAIIDETLARTEFMTECGAAKIVAAAIPAESGLFLASSMPIRLFDMFADPIGQVLTVGANRGASGIDGTIASASGFAEGLSKRVTLVIGDLALLHDLNSLALLRHVKNPVTIVCLNNNGGSIFGHLSIANFPDIFSKYFVTPHDLTFEHAASQFRIEYTRVRSPRDLVAVYRTAIEQDSHAFIEVTIDRAQNQKFHDDLLKRIALKLDTL